MIRIVSIISMVFVCLVMFLPTAQAEDIEYTVCFSGTFTMFHEVKGAPFALSYAQNGIIMSDDKRFNNMIVHCEGVQMGFGPKRKGYGLCTAKDLDGDMIIFGGPYRAPGDSDYKWLFGTGKWKGIKGSLEGQRIVRSKPGKGAMPGTYQGCNRIKGTFELPPK